MFHFIQTHSVMATAAFYVIGLFTPYIQNRLERIVQSDKYKFLDKVYQDLDPQFLNLIKGQVPFVETIEKSILAASDGSLSMAEINKITQLVIRDFSMVKALRKTPNV